jgi:hypothetical protein
MGKGYKHPAVRAAKAHTELCLFAAVVNLMEGGDIGGDANSDATAIIRACKRAQARALYRYDKAMSEIED